MYSSISLNEDTRNLVAALKDDTMFMYDIISNELSDEQKAQVRTWYKEGQDLDTIRFKVMTEFLSCLSPKKNSTNKNDKDIDDR